MTATRRLCAAVLTACLTVFGWVSAASADTPPPSVSIADPGSPVFPLSNERSVTSWANPARVAPIYADPEHSPRHFARLHRQTEDGFPEVYVLLGETTDASGQTWVDVRIPGRPNGRTGWVRRSALGPFQQTHWLLVVDRRLKRLTAYWNGKQRFVAPVGIGKPNTPTPAGNFWVRERFRVPDPTSPYFPYAIGTSAYSSLSEWPGGGVVGIHGDWGRPRLIPGDPSHGCIRMHNRDIAWLATRVSVGTPLDVI